MSEKKRIQLDFTEDAAARLDELVRITGAASRAELMRRALALLDRALYTQQHGGMLLLRGEDGREREIVIM